MDKIDFKDLPNTTTPINASNLNALQTNVEKVSIRKQSIPVSMGAVQGWYLVGSANLTGYDNASLTFLVEQVFGTGSAILKLNIRCNNGNNLLKSEFCFNEITGGLNHNNFKLYLNGNNFYLYTNNASEYGMVNFTLLNEKTLNSNLSYGIWNFNAPQYNENISEPTGDNVSIPTYIGNLSDTGWIALPLATDVTTYDWLPLSYRKIGNIVYINGTFIQENATWLKLIANIPYKPAYETDYVCRALRGGQAHTVGIDANGNLYYLVAIGGDSDTTKGGVISLSYITN